MAGWRARAARAVLGAVTLTAAVGTLGAASDPVAAAPARPRGEIVVDEVGDQVFVTEGDTVGVYDLDGQRTATIAGQVGAVDLVLHDRTLYVLAVGAERLNRVDADTLAVTGGWSTETHPQPSGLAWAEGRVWFTDLDSRLVSLDPATGTQRSYGVGLAADRHDLVATGSPARLYALELGWSPSRVTSVDLSGPTPAFVQRSSHSSDACENGQEMAVSTDGSTGWTACGAPYRFTRWDLATLADPTTALTAVNYPRAIARSADGGFLVGAISGLRPQVRLYEAGATEPIRTFSTVTDMASGMVAVADGGSRIFVGMADGSLRTIRLDPAVTSVAPSPVDRGEVVTVTGTGMTDVTEAEVGGVAADVAIFSDTTVEVTVPEGLVNGTYPLLLTNDWGDSADTPATVRVHGPEAPHAPGQPSVVAAGPHAATVTWPALDEDSWPATSFEVTARVGGEAVATETGAASPATLTGLRAETARTFTVVAVDEEGRSPASPPSVAHTPAGPDVTPFPSIAAFVARQHLDLLGRAPLVGESEAWVDDLQLGIRQPTDLVVSLRGSADHAANVDPVVRMYQAYFLRTPDADGLRYWIGERRAGRSINQVSQAFAASGEFRTLYGSLTNRQFVGRIYRNVLGRTGSPAEIDYWTTELDSGRRNRGGVMVGFSESAEYRAAQRSEVTTSVLHVLLLGRRPTTGELATTVARLDGGTPVATIAGEILQSEEYAEHIAG